MNSKAFMVCEFYLFYTMAQCSLVERLYRRSPNTSSAQHVKYQITQAKRSAIECAAACVQGDGCASFSFSKKTRSCRTSSDITGDISDNVYYVVCPSELGYSLWTFDDKTLCLKYARYRLNNEDAVASCRNDKAHLAAIDSDNTRLLVLNMLTELDADSVVCPSELGYSLWTFDDKTLCLKYARYRLNNEDAVASCRNDKAHLAAIDSDNTRLLVLNMLTELDADSGWIYFDGYDVGDQDIFHTWNGQLLWTSWNKDNPDKGAENCIVGKLDHDLLTTDQLCSRVLSYVCQIDLV